jgi:hypothetical protein
MRNSIITSRQVIKYLKFPALPVILGANLAITTLAPKVLAQTTLASFLGNAVTFTCNDSEATIKAKNGPKAIFGTRTIYIGYQQVASVNKDPRMIRFDNGVRKWCRSDYETTSDDGTGYGLLWNGGGVLYGVFTSTGSQTGNNFWRFAAGRWLPSYGSGGGAKVAVIARINPTTGDVNYATFVSARKLSDGKTNSLVIRGLSWNGTTLTVEADSWSSPRRADRSSMTCSGSSPFKYTAVFTGDLIKVNSATAVTCN